MANVAQALHVTVTGGVSGQPPADHGAALLRQALASSAVAQAARSISAIFMGWQTSPRIDQAAVAALSVPLPDGGEQVVLARIRPSAELAHDYLRGLTKGMPLTVTFVTPREHDGDLTVRSPTPMPATDAPNGLNDPDQVQRSLGLAAREAAGPLLGGAIVRQMPAGAVIAQVMALLGGSDQASAMKSPQAIAGNLPGGNTIPLELRSALVAAIRLQTIPVDPDMRLSADRLKNAIHASGILHEKHLATGHPDRAAADAKALWLGVMARLGPHAGADEQAARSPSNVALVPLRGGGLPPAGFEAFPAKPQPFMPPSTQPPLQPSPSGIEPPRSAVTAALPEQLSHGIDGSAASALVRLAEGALERIRLLQFASLASPGDPPAAGGSGMPAQRIVTELPLQLPFGIATMPLEIEREPPRKHPSRPGEAEAGWRLSLSLDLPDLGPVRAELALRGSAMSVRLAAERRSTVDLIMSERHRLAASLTDIGATSADDAVTLRVEHVSAGLAPSARPHAGYFVDRGA